MEVIYKILTLNEWEKFQQESIFLGSALDQKDGFIHNAFEHQVSGVLDRFFKGAGELIRLTVDPQKLEASTLKIEANRPGGDCYPHVYGSLPITAVLQHEKIWH